MPVYARSDIAVGAVTVIAAFSIVNSAEAVPVYTFIPVTVTVGCGSFAPGTLVLLLYVIV